jgi:hypothetical protein
MENVFVKINFMMILRAQIANHAIINVENAENNVKILPIIISLMHFQNAKSARAKQDRIYLIVLALKDTMMILRVMNVKNVKPIVKHAQADLTIVLLVLTIQLEILLTQLAFANQDFSM